MPPAKKSLTLSYASIGVIVGLLTITGAVWKVGSAIATKDDVASIKTSIQPELDRHEGWILDLKLQMARFMGTAARNDSEPRSRNEVPPTMVLARYQANQMAIPQRRTVVPDELIQAFHLEPTHGGSYAVLGADGKLYSIDDVLAMLIHLELQDPQIQASLKKVGK